MKSILYRMVVIGLLYPYLVDISTDSSNSPTTEFGFAVGHGSYARVSRDCAGNIVSVEDIPYTDGGISIDHYFSAFRVGAKAGLVNKNNHDDFDFSSYINPNVGLNTKYFGLDIGVLGNGKFYIPSGALRIGSRKSVYLMTGFANNLPIFTGGGLLDIGLGFSLGKPHSNLWLGVLRFPSTERFGFSVKADIPYSNHFIVTFRGHAGGSHSLEYGLSLGGKFIY